jgi:hypothetical protein
LAIELVQGNSYYVYFQLYFKHLMELIQEQDLFEDFKELTVVVVVVVEAVEDFVDSEDSEEVVEGVTTLHFKQVRLWLENLFSSSSSDQDVYAFRTSIYPF